MCQHAFLFFFFFFNRLASHADIKSPPWIYTPTTHTREMIMDDRQRPVRAAGPRKSHMWSIRAVFRTHLSSRCLSAWMCKETQTQQETQSVRETPSRLWGQGYTSSPSHTHTGSEAQLQQNAHTVILKYQGSSVTCRAVRNERMNFELIVAAPVVRVNNRIEFLPPVCWLLGAGLMIYGVYVMIWRILYTETHNTTDDILGDFATLTSTRYDQTQSVCFIEHTQCVI